MLSGQSLEELVRVGDSHPDLLDAFLDLIEERHAPPTAAPTEEQPVETNGPFDARLPVIRATSSTFQEMTRGKKRRR